MASFVLKFNILLVLLFIGMLCNEIEGVPMNSDTNVKSNTGTSQSKDNSKGTKGSGSNTKSNNPKADDKDKLKDSILKGLTYHF